jgi:hypothetical protein
MARPIDRTKQSNCVCKNCRAWSWFRRCYDEHSPQYMEVRGPRNTCLFFEWSDEILQEGERHEPNQSD